MWHITKEIQMTWHFDFHIITTLGIMYLKKKGNKLTFYSMIHMKNNSITILRHNNIYHNDQFSFVTSVDPIYLCIFFNVLLKGKKIDRRSIEKRWLDIIRYKFIVIEDMTLDKNEWRLCISVRDNSRSLVVFVICDLLYFRLFNYLMFVSIHFS